LRIWLTETKGEAAGHSGKRYPYPAVHATAQTVTMQESSPQPHHWSAGYGHVAEGMSFPSSAGLLGREVTPTIDPVAVRAAAVPGGRGERKGVAQGRHLHCRAWPGGAHISPATAFP